MQLKPHEQAWTHWGTADPLWAVLSDPSKQGGKWDLSEFLSSGRRDVDAILSELEELGLRPQAGRALDFGCGPGRLTQALAARFGQVLGVDISSSMLELARKYNQHGEKCQFVHNTSDSLDWLEHAAFDFGLSLMTFQHIPAASQRKYLQGLLAALKPGGVLVVQIPERRRRPNRAERITERVVRWGYNSTPEPWTWLLYWRARRRQANAIEMHVMSRRKLAAAANRAGSTLVASRPDDRAGPWFTSFMHVFVKDS